VFRRRAPASNWLRFHAATGLDVEAALDDRSPMRPMGTAVTARLAISDPEGRMAWAIIEKLNGGRSSS